MVTFQIEIDPGRIPTGGATTILHELGITGEVGLRATSNGKWILEICAEGNLSESALLHYGTVTKYGGAASE